MVDPKKQPKEPPASPDPGLAILSKNLVLWMGVKDIGQKRLAQLAQVNETYVRDIINGSSQNPTVFKLQRICDALGCALDDLLTEGGRHEILRVFASLSPENQREVVGYAIKLKRLEELERARSTSG